MTRAGEKPLEIRFHFRSSRNCCTTIRKLNRPVPPLNICLEFVDPNPELNLIVSEFSKKFSKKIIFKWNHCKIDV